MLWTSRASASSQFARVAPLESRPGVDNRTSGKASPRRRLQAMSSILGSRSFVFARKHAFVLNVVRNMATAQRAILNRNMGACQWYIHMSRETVRARSHSSCMACLACCVLNGRLGYRART